MCTISTYQRGSRLDLKCITTLSYNQVYEDFFVCFCCFFPFSKIIFERITNNLPEVTLVFSILPKCKRGYISSGCMSPSARLSPFYKAHIHEVDHFPSRHLHESSCNYHQLIQACFLNDLNRLEQKALIQVDEQKVTLCDSRKV